MPDTTNGKKEGNKGKNITWKESELTTRIIFQRDKMWKKTFFIQEDIMMNESGSVRGMACLKVEVLNAR